MISCELPVNNRDHFLQANFPVLIACSHLDYFQIADNPGLNGEIRVWTKPLARRTLRVR
jgi:hypothetical protein